jgi:esterase/lipase superfamily enzyme
MLQRGLALVALLLLLTAAPSWPARADPAPADAPAATAPLDIAALNAAYAANDTATLERASQDEALFAQIAATDPDAAIAMRLAVARKLTGDAAVQAYKHAIAGIESLRGANDISLADPLRELGQLQLSLGARDDGLASLHRSVAVVIAAMGEDHEMVAPYKAAYEAAAGQPYKAEATRGIHPKRPYHLVQIYYATRRSPTGSLEPASFYGGDAGPLRYGRALISLPNDRQVGDLPQANIFALEFRPDPARHVILTSVKPLGDRNQFMAAVSQTVAASHRKEVFVFIHGFNTSFQDGAERTAQLADDLAIDGAPILYSWPSKANPLAYGDDEATSGDAGELNDLAAFLADVAQKTGATRVNLVAHSMGNRFLVRALSRLADRPPAARPRFNEIVLASPDVGIDEFTRLWPKIRPMGQRYTLYASRRDRALQLSGQIHQMLRLGDASRTTPIDRLETVDTTAASGGLLGHTDFAGTALDDFRAVIWASLSPDKRCVLETQRSGPRFWVFTPVTGAACTDTEFRGMLAYLRTSTSPGAALQRVRAQQASAAPAQRSHLQDIERRLVAVFGANPQ